MRGKKLTNEISIQELQQMREEGLTNRQIAERLDLTYRTVIRYLGPQPKGLRANYGEYKTRVKDVEPEKKEGRQISLMEQYRKTVYAGEDFNYTVLSAGSVKITPRGAPEVPIPLRGDPYLELNADQVGPLVKELLDIVYMLQEGLC